MGSARLLALVVVALVCGPALPACDNSGSTGTVTRGDDDTSGGESGGEGGSAGRVDAPPGSQEPGDDDLEGGASADAGAGGTTTAAESPWGRPETETGEPLPARPPVSGSARDAYRRGLEAGQRGDTAAARRAFEEALRADPNSFRAAYNLGVLTDREGNPDGALTYYRQALRIQPDYERAAEGIVTIYIRRGQAADAVAFMEPLARRWVRNLHIQALYGEALVHANRPPDAITAARAALRRDERFVPAMIVLIKANLRLSRTELAESILDQAIAIDANQAELHFLKGRMQQQANQLGPALQSYRRAVELRPDYADARMALALQLLAGANYEEAVAQFEAVSRLVSGLPEVYLGLGNAYRSVKQWTKSKAELDRVIAVSPRSAEAHYALGLLYMEAGAEYPGSDLLTSLNRAREEFAAYREIMGPRIARDDPATGYIEEIGRQIEREQRRIERDAARRQREAERAARQAAEPPAEGAAPTSGTAPAGGEAGAGGESGAGGAQ
jgi:tetratricopeptide (TPR) repeat protein